MSTNDDVVLDTLTEKIQRQDRFIAQLQADRMAVLVFAAPFLPLGLIVMSNLADGNYRYLPDWAPVWAAWCFGIVAACLGASALWTGLRSGD